MKRAIVIPSIGDRPWLGSVIATVDPYARRCHADLIVEREFPLDFAFPRLPDKPGRPNKELYACKSYFAWKHLASYDRLVILDDTCCVSRTAEDIFDAVPTGCCGFTATSPEHAKSSFETIRGHLEARGDHNVVYDANDYMNSGVMLYEGWMRDAFSPARIITAADLLFNPRPHQTLVYFLLKRANIPCFTLPKRFNSFPAMQLNKDERRELKDVVPFLARDRDIYHVSGLYRHREEVIRQICQVCLAG